MAPPLLLVHGAWHGAWCWEEGFADRLRDRGLEAHAMDLPGHGRDFRGTRALRWRRMADYVDAVANVAAELREPPIVVGHSMGGMVVQKYLERHPAPAAVLLASVPPRGVLRTTLHIARQHPWRFLLVNLRLSLAPLVETRELTRELFHAADADDGDVARWHDQIHDESYRAFLDMLVLALPRPRRVDTPMLVMGAEDDTIFTPAEVRATAAAYGVEATIYSDMAHDMMLGRGWAEVADAVADWVTTAGGRATA